MEAFDLAEPTARRFRIGEKRGVAADLRQTRRIGGDDWAAQGHGLEDGQPEPLRQRWKGEAKRFSIDRREIVVGDETEHLQVGTGRRVRALARKTWTRTSREESAAIDSRSFIVAAAAMVRASIIRVCPVLKIDRGVNVDALEHVLKKLLDFFDSDTLQLFEFALRPYRWNGSF